jgi:hypothetical protein
MAAEARWLWSLVLVLPLLHSGIDAAHECHDLDTKMFCFGPTFASRNRHLDVLAAGTAGMAGRMPLWMQDGRGLHVQRAAGDSAVLFLQAQRATASTNTLFFKSRIASPRQLFFALEMNV